MNDVGARRHTIQGAYVFELQGVFEQLDGHFLLFFVGGGVLLHKIFEQGGIAFPWLVVVYAFKNLLFKQQNAQKHPY